MKEITISVSDEELLALESLCTDKYPSIESEHLCVDLLNKMTRQYDSSVMYHKQQLDWLITNGFVEVPCEYKLVYSKQLSNDRELWFSFYGGSCTWDITIYDGDYSGSGCTLVVDISHDTNFNQFLPLIEMIQ